LSVRALGDPQEIRYVRLITNANAKIAKMIRDAKTEFFDEQVDKIPLLHGF
jgi:hypothetical protein